MLWSSSSSKLEEKHIHTLSFTHENSYSKLEMLHDTLINMQIYLSGSIRIFIVFIHKYSKNVSLSIECKIN